MKVEFDPKSTPTFPDGGTPEDKAAFMVSMLKFHNDAMTGHVPEFAAIRPSYLAIFNPIPFPNYLTFNGKHIGLFVKKASWPKLIYLRLLLVLKPNRKKSTQNDVGS